MFDSHLDEVHNKIGHMRCFLSSQLCGALVVCVCASVTFVCRRIPRCVAIYVMDCVYVFAFNRRPFAGNVYINHGLVFVQDRMCVFVFVCTNKQSMCVGNCGGKIETSIILVEWVRIQITIQTYARLCDMI